MVMITHPFDRHYFHGGAKVGGYAGEGYRDFPVHWNTYNAIMQRSPTSVLELGCGRGYVLKRLQDWGGMRAAGLEISEHCHLTRAIEEITTHDITKGPWPIPGAEPSFDLCVSMAFLEHVSEDKLSIVFDEMKRTCHRGLHGIDIHDGDGFDKTHCTIRPLDWWKERMPPGHEAINKEELEAGPVQLPPTINQGVKLNLGSFTHMFHGWRNIDRIDLSPWARRNGYSFVCHDISTGVPYDDGVVDLIFMSHVLEHFNYAAGRALLRECRRVLKPGGTIRIAVPDAAVLFYRHSVGDLDKLREISALPDDALSIELLNEFLYGGDHRAIYDDKTLVNMLLAAGFTTAIKRNFRDSGDPRMRRETIDLYPELSLFVEATI